MDRQLVSVSTLSLQETVSSGEYSSSTVSRSTFNGLGSLSGRALLNFGKLTLKGVEQLIISRRLATIFPNFPHHESDHIPGLHSMYADLLELSRIHMYPKLMRIRALQILMRQIACRSTTHFLKALLTWPVVETELLISEILPWFNPIRFSILAHRPYRAENVVENPILSAYRDHLSKWEDHSVTPIIDFLRVFACSTEQGWSTILNCGCLDLLLQLYVSDFQDPMTADSNSSTKSFSKSSISAACNSFIMEALGNERSRKVIELHPLQGLWPLWPMLPFRNIIVSRNRCLQRREMWLSVEKKHIQWRISSVYDMLVNERPAFFSRVRTTLAAESFLLDLIIDLLEFSGSSVLDDETCFRALRSMHKLWSRIYNVELTSGIRMYIQEMPEDHVREIFIRIVCRLTLLSVRAQKSEPFFEPCHRNCLRDGCPLELDGVIHFIHWLTRASQTDELLCQWLIDGYMLQLLDTITTHLFSYGALSSQEAVNLQEGQEQHMVAHHSSISHGPHYRALVLSMAQKLFTKNPKDIASLIPSPPNQCLEFEVVEEHDDHDWAEVWLNSSVFHTKEHDHRKDVYSWIM